MGEITRRVVLGGMAGAAAVTVAPLRGQATEAAEGLWAWRLTVEHVVDPLGIDVVASAPARSAR